MCGAVSPVPMFHVPACRDNCTFYFYCCHEPLCLCANGPGSVGEQNIIMTELKKCELCLYHSAGSVSCGCVIVCNLLLAVSEVWKFGYEALKNYAELYLMISCFSHHHRNITVINFVTACMSVTLRMLNLWQWFLGTFIKLWKATTSIVMSVFLCVCMEHLSSHWMDFHEVW